MSLLIFHLCFFMVVYVSIYIKDVRRSFTSVATYMVNLLFPDILRTMVLYANTGIDNTMYYKMGVCDYCMPHALPALIAPIVLWLKAKDFRRSVKGLIIIFLFFLLLLVWTSGATTPFLVAVFALLVSSIINQRKSIKNNVATLLFISIMALPFTFDEVQLSIVHTLESIIPEDNANYGKLKDYEETKFGNKTTSDASYRGELYNQSFSTFMDNIFLGTNSKKEIGEHSIFFDRLAMLGIVGITPFLLVFFFLFRYMYRKTIPNQRLFILVGIISFLVIFFLKNMLGTWMYAAVFVMLPIMIDYKKLISN